MESMKETAVKIAASAKSGMEKTKATVQEKVEKMTTCDPVEKQMAKEKKEERITEAELKKREELASCSPGTRTDSVPGPGKAQSYSTTGEKGRPTGMLEQMSALPGHGTGEPAGQVVEGVVPSHPIGVATGTERASTAHNPRSGYGTNKGYGTGGTYN